MVVVYLKEGGGAFCHRVLSKSQAPGWNGTTIQPEQKMPFTLNILSDTFAICRLNAATPIPKWANGRFVSITRTPDELSIVCEQDQIPNSVQAERGWRVLQIAEKLDFSLTGVISKLTTVLAESKIGVFVISTFDTDYILVKERDLERAVEAVKRAGYSIGTQ